MFALDFDRRVEEAARGCSRPTSPVIVPVCRKSRTNDTNLVHRRRRAFRGGTKYVSDGHRVTSKESDSVLSSHYSRHLLTVRRGIPTTSPCGKVQHELRYNVLGAGSKGTLNVSLRVHTIVQGAFQRSLSYLPELVFPCIVGNMVVI